ncbi:uncharacterized protein VTP21DRAFT_434 [Calcarisporiella thermophila]|uniref:uncharacterized protein n=1 Tax=Calcarisporiella thermophila TaxID=911321 RepID=UPI0037444462
MLAAPAAVVKDRLSSVTSLADRMSKVGKRKSSHDLCTSSSGFDRIDKPEKPATLRKKASLRDLGQTLVRPFVRERPKCPEEREQLVLEKNPDVFLKPVAPPEKHPQRSAAKAPKRLSSLRDLRDLVMRPIKDPDHGSRSESSVMPFPAYPPLKTTGRPAETERPPDVPAMPPAPTKVPAAPKARTSIRDLRERFKRARKVYKSEKEKAKAAKPAKTLPKRSSFRSLQDLFGKTRNDPQAGRDGPLTTDTPPAPQEPTKNPSPRKSDGSPLKDKQVERSTTASSTTHSEAGSIEADQGGPRVSALKKKKSFQLSVVPLEDHVPSLPPPLPENKAAKLESFPALPCPTVARCDSAVDVEDLEPKCLKSTVPPSLPRTTSFEFGLDQRMLSPTSAEGKEREEIEKEWRALEAASESLTSLRGPRECAGLVTAGLTWEAGLTDRKQADKLGQNKSIPLDAVAAPNQPAPPDTAIGVSEASPSLVPLMAIARQLSSSIEFVSDNKRDTLDHLLDSMLNVHLSQPNQPHVAHPFPSKASPAPLSDGLPRDEMRSLSPSTSSTLSSASFLSEPGTLSMVRQEPSVHRSLHPSPILSADTVKRATMEEALGKEDVQAILDCVSDRIFESICHNHRTKRFKTEPILNNNDTATVLQLPYVSTSKEDISEMLRVVFECGELGPECAIITLVYIDRMCKNTGVTLHDVNWIRILLGGLVLAVKVWDDHAVYNCDFCVVFPDFDVKKINELERWYIEALQYDVGIHVSLYTEYRRCLQARMAQTGSKSVNSMLHNQEKSWPKPVLV